MCSPAAGERSSRRWIAIRKGIQRKVDAGEAIQTAVQ
jgi:hypothetical protein